MEVVDNATFAAKPEQRTEAKEKILALGKTFENAGVYIAKRLNGIESGREIAEALALEFYQYGQSLIHGRLEEVLPIDELAARDLTSQETDTVDQFLAGDSLYESRKQRAEKLNNDNQAEKDTAYEAERQKTLAQFFRVAEKSFILESKSTGEELQKSPNTLKPWQNDAPIHSAFLKRIERALTKHIETPKWGLKSSIFRRGMDLLQHNMPFDKIPESAKNAYLHWRNGEKTLRDALQIDHLKDDLEQTRQHSKDLKTITQKEREIADKIQTVVSNFPYQDDADNPSEMVANQHINCVGASMLGGALMKEVGLNYLVCSVPEHSVLFLVTSDGQVEWRDMLNASSGEHLTDEMIKGQKKDGHLLTLADIVAFSQKPKSEGLMFDIDSPKYREKLHWVKEGQHQFVTVFDPEYGHQIQVLNNTGCALADLDRLKEAVEVYQTFIKLPGKGGDADWWIKRFNNAILFIKAKFRFVQKL